MRSSLPNAALTIALTSSALAQLVPSPAYLPPAASSGDSTSSLSSLEQWSNLLGNTLFYYDAQRTGELGNTSRVDWRNSSCIDDGSDVNLDLSGGYFDAGDFIKASFPLGFVLSSLAWGAVDYGQGYELANQTAYLDGVMRWGLNWLIKAHPEPSTLYVQVGNSTLDNNYWGGDLDIPGPRPSYKIDGDSPGTDAAAQVAAAFAASSFLYSGQTFNSSVSSSIALADANYSSTLLSHAQDLYQFANSSKRQTYQTAVPAAGDAYASSNFGDDLTWAALWLSVATNSSSYFTDATTYYKQYKLSGSSLVFNWDSMTPALPILFLQVVQNRPWLAGGASESYWQGEAENILDDIVGKDALKGGLLWFEGNSNSASLNPALNAAMLLFRYAPLASSLSKSNSYTNMALQQRDYALGDNPMSAPYIVGQSSNSPKNPHSSMASGGNNISAINTDPEQEAYVLYGSVVGGPDEEENFFDIRSDWPQTEGALDYNAPLATLAAYSVLYSSSTPPFFATLAAGAYIVPEGHPCDAVFPCFARDGRGNLSSGAIFAIAFSLFGLVMVLLALAAWRWLGWFRPLDQRNK